MKHSPTPWSADFNGHYWTLIAPEFGQIGDMCSSSCSEPEYGCSLELGQANAEFAALAVNSHDELLSACLGVRAMLEGMGQPIPDMLQNAITLGQGGVVEGAKAEGK